MRAGFIGLGVQGKFLAVNLARAGHDLMVFDLRPEPLKELAAEGARIAHSSREVGQHAEIIEICVVDDAQVEEVVLGEDGVLAGAEAGKIIVIHSTIHPDTVAKIAAAARPRQVEVMDVAVSGSEAGARNRTMCYMAGGSRAAFEKCEPLFRTSANSIFHVGELGAGIRAKLAHQVMICVNMLSAYEGMMLGVKAGVPPEALEQVIHGGMAQSRVADRWHEFRPGERSIPIFYKDLRLALEFAHSLGLSLPATAFTQQLIGQILSTDK